MDLAHGQAPTAEPAAVEVTEPRVAVAVRVPLQVLEVEQLQRDTGPTALGVDPRAVGSGALPLARDLRPAIEPAFESRVGQRLDLWPIQPGGPRSREDAGDRAQPDPEALAHRPVTESQSPLLAEDVPDLPHG